MHICPECKGEKKFTFLRYRADPTDRNPPLETENCMTCKGKGEISDLKLAIIKARGY
jgi:hypothetical protein